MTLRSIPTKKRPQRPEDAVGDMAWAKFRALDQRNRERFLRRLISTFCLACAAAFDKNTGECPNGCDDEEDEDDDLSGEDESDEEEEEDDEEDEEPEDPHPAAADEEDEPEGEPV